MIGVIILLVGSTAVFELQKSLNLIWHVEVLPQKDIHYPESTTFSFGLILAIAFLLLVSLIISTGLSSIAN
jgi:membrane protein